MGDLPESTEKASLTLRAGAGNSSQTLQAGRVTIHKVERAEKAKRTDTTERHERTESFETELKES